MTEIIFLEMRNFVSLEEAKERLARKLIEMMGSSLSEATIRLAVEKLTAEDFKDGEDFYYKLRICQIDKSELEKVLTPIDFSWSNDRGKWGVDGGTEKESVRILVGEATIGEDLHHFANENGNLKWKRDKVKKPSFQAEKPMILLLNSYEWEQESLEEWEAEENYLLLYSYPPTSGRTSAINWFFRLHYFFEQI